MAEKIQNEPKKTSKLIDKTSKMAEKKGQN